MAIFELLKDSCLDVLVGDFNVWKMLAAMLILSIPALVKFIIAVTKLEGKEAFSNKSVVVGILKVVILLRNFFHKIGEIILNMFR